MLLQGQDGEMRVIEFGNSARGGTTFYLEILFTEMDLSAPISKTRPEETLHMNRNKFDSNAHYAKGPDTPRYEPIPLTFSCRLADTINSRALSDWLSGATAIPTSNGVSTIYSWKGGSAGIDGNSLPGFTTDSGLQAYLVETIFDGTNDLGYQWNEVVFTPSEVTITEAADSLILNASGQIYGDVTRLTAFSSYTEFPS